MAETSGNLAISPANTPGDHAACDAEIARLRAALRRHVLSFTDPKGTVLCGGCLEPAPCPDVALAGKEATP